MSKFISFISILLLLSACGGGNTSSITGGFTIVLSDGDRELVQSDVMDISAWIELKADSSTYIKNVKKIALKDDSYYVLDNIGQKCVMRYDADGNFINRIGKYGIGPDEYPAIYDFSIDHVNGLIWILSSSSTVYVYDLDGHFKGKKRLSPSQEICGITSNQCGILATTGYASSAIDGNAYLLMQFNSDFNLEGKKLIYDKPLQPPFSPLSIPLQNVNGVTYYGDNINLRLVAYDCLTDSVSIPIRFSLKNPMPVEMYDDLMTFMAHQQDYNWIKSISILTSGLIVEYIYDGEMCMLISDFSGDILMSGNYNGIFPECFVMDDYILSPVTPDVYLDYWQHQSDVIKPGFKVNEDTNVMLLKWKCKI